MARWNRLERIDVLDSLRSVWDVQFGSRWLGLLLETGDGSTTLRITLDVTIFLLKLEQVRGLEHLLGFQ